MPRKPSYKSMTPSQQRVIDERDIEILRRVDDGETYAAIQRDLCVSPSTIAKLVRECVE